MARTKSQELAELRRVEIVNKALQAIVVVLLAATAYWTQSFISDTKELAGDFGRLTVQMQEFSEKMTQNVIDLDRRVLILEHERAPR